MWSGYGEAVWISPAHVAVGGNGIKIAVTLIENAAPFATDSVHQATSVILRTVLMVRSHRSAEIEVSAWRPGAVRLAPR